MIRPLDTSLIPHLGSLRPSLRAIPALDRGGAVLGVPYQWGPNLLIWNPRVVAKAPISWNALYIKRNAGRVSIPDDPIQIADAALLAGAQHPSLHIRSPFQLSERQLRAALKLLKRQKAHLAEQVGRGLGPGQRVRQRRRDDRRRLVVRGARAAQAGRPRALRDPARGCDGVARRMVARLHRGAPRLRVPLPRLRDEGVGAGEDVPPGRRGAGLAGRLPPAGHRDVPRARLRAGPRLRAPALPHDAGHVVPGRPALHERRALERGLGASLALEPERPGAAADAGTPRGQPRRHRGPDSGEVVVHVAGGLLQRVGGGRPDESEPGRPQRLRERRRLRRRRGDVGEARRRRLARAGDGRARAAGNDVPLSRSASTARAFAIVASIFWRLRTMPASPSSRSTSAGPERGDQLGIEAREGAAESLALAQDRQPRETRLESLEAHTLVQAALVDARDAPTPRRGSARTGGRRRRSSELPRKGDRSR